MANFNSRNLKIGQYSYGRHYNCIGIWVCSEITENSSSHTFVKDVQTWEEAKEFVYRMNGWTKKSA